MDEATSVIALKKARAKRAFKLFRDLQANPSKNWLVEGMLGEGEASVVYGRPGDGKSVLAEDLALHIAAGRDWHGRKVRSGAVLFIALERKQLVERRAIAFRERYGVPDLPFALLGGVYDFRKPEVVEAICETVKAVETAVDQSVVLIVIDTLSRALCGGDENSSKDIGAIVAATSLMQESGPHVLWLHHTPLDAGDRMRGHGALLGAVDTTICVVKQTDDTRAATVIKANDSEEGVTVTFTIQSQTINTDDLGNVTSAPVVIPVEGAERRPPQQRQKPVRLARSSKIAKRALVKGIDEAGETAPASNTIPQGVRVTTIEMWKRYAYQAGISDGEDRAKRAAFQRAYECLVDEGLVAVWGEYVWLVRSE